MAMDPTQLYKAREQAFLTSRVYIRQWCEKLVSSYDALPEETKAQLPPLPGRSAEEIFPSLFAEPFDIEQYKKETVAPQQLQQAMVARVLLLNAEAEKCLSR